MVTTLIMPTLPQLDEIRDTLAFLDDWEDRYRYVMELGRALPPLAEGERTEATRVRGCASQVWLVADRVPSPEGPRLTLRGDSDAHIVRGLVAIAIALFSGRTVEDITATDAHGFFREIGLADHLTAQRANGLHAMVERIKAQARAA